MSKKRALILTGSLVSLIGATVLCIFVVYFARLPEQVDAMETIVLGQTRFVPGSQTAMRVIVRNISDQKAIPGAEVIVSFKPVDGGPAVHLFSGTTDAIGAANVSFHVPQDLDPNQQLIIETSTAQGADHLDQIVTLDRSYKILLSSDKPLYQPGQVIHLRALALSTFDRVPAASQELEFIIADGKGNKVFRKSVTTSDFGIAAVDFQLASEVNTGPYKITAQMGNTSSEKTVTVEHYVLPKFKVTWSTDRSFYLPGDRVSGSLSAEYFFGKHVAGGDVVIDGFTFDFERQDIFAIQGQTDADGVFNFDFNLPDYIVGTEVEGGAGRFYLEASVTDLAQHTEVSSHSLPMAQSSLIIKAIPESGQIRAGVENILYILTTYPDGTPAQTTLRVNVDGQETILETGKYGLAEFRFVPQSAWTDLEISARDELGSEVEQYFYFEGDWSEETVLLRPDRAAYRIGEVMQLDVLTSQQTGMVYLDIVREGQTVSTRSLEITDGHAQAAVDLTPDLFGTLELHAYKILSWGGIARDTRLVIVDAPSDLALSITTDQDQYRPGETAGLMFQVSDPDGQGAQSALGMAIVDESVFALAQQDPGFAKLYFMLEAELLSPKYDIHGFSIPDLVGQPPQDPVFLQAVEGAAQASLAEAAGFSTPFSLNLNSHDVKIQAAYDRQNAFFDGLSKGLFIVELLLPLAIMAFMVHSVIRQKALAGGLTLFFVLLLGFTLVVFLLPVPDWIGNQPLDRLGYLLERLTFGGMGFALALGGAGIAGFIALAVYAFRRKDKSLGWALVLTLSFIPFSGMLIFAASNSSVTPTESTMICAVLIFLLIPTAYLLRAAGFGVKLQLGWAFAAFLSAPVVLIGLLVPLATLSFGAPLMANGIGMRGGIMDQELGVDMAMPPLAMAEVESAKTDEEVVPRAPGEPPRLRQFFPETMYWQPELVTDSDGHLDLEIDMADSITTWRLTALASTQDGRLGATTLGLRVFQDFFIDLDLPLALTQNDEISVPVGVFNYLPDKQQVTLVLDQGDWFELLDKSEKEITIAGNDIEVVYFRIRATGFGRKALKVTAFGSHQSDAIQKEVSVFPDGKQMRFSIADRLPAQGVSQTIDIPSTSIPGTQHLSVKIYPGVVSQVVEGLDSLLRMPYGCFEQTTSITYPNVLALDYMQTTGQVSPEVQFKAEEYINLGYQRLLTFEVTGGGFSLFGDAPADRMLTAYGLQEFSEMSQVYSVDREIIQRAAEWLLAQQSSDGSWENDQGLVHENIWQNLQNDRLPVTAYIVWSLIEAGYYDDSRLQAGLDYIKEHRTQADDPYVLTLVANALVAADLEDDGISSFTDSVLDDLTAMAQYDGDAAFWKSSVATFMGSEGQTGSIETTGMAAFALLRANRHPEAANAALTFLVRQKDSFGTWHSTQATIMALKALLESVKIGEDSIDATVTILLNGGQARTVSITTENFDVVQLISFDDISPGTQNKIEILVKGEGELMYQIHGSYYLPWKDALAIEDQSPADLVMIEVSYDRTELSVDDTVHVDVSVSLNTPGRAEWALIDLGIPPGFVVKTEDLNALVNRFEDVPDDYPYPTVERYELTGRQVLVYIGGLSSEQPLSFSYRLQAKFPITARTPASSVYDYYNPDVNGEQAPIEIVVNP